MCCAVQYLFIFPSSYYSHKKTVFSRNILPMTFYGHNYRVILIIEWASSVREKHKITLYLPFFLWLTRLYFITSFWRFSCSIIKFIPKLIFISPAHLYVSSCEAMRWREDDEDLLENKYNFIISILLFARGHEYECVRNFVRSTRGAGDVWWWDLRYFHFEVLLLLSLRG